MTLISIVGATGVLGQELVPLLLQQGHKVRSLSPSPERAVKIFGQDVEAVECDLTSPTIPERLPKLLEGSEIVLHIATAIPRDATAPGAWVATTRLRTDGT